MQVVVPRKIRELPIEAINRALQRQNTVLRLLILPLVEFRGIKTAQSENRGRDPCEERRVRNVRNLEIGVVRAGDQTQARIGIEERREIGETSLLPREVMDRIKKRHRVFDAFIGLQITAGEEILYAAETTGRG